MCEYEACSQPVSISDLHSGVVGRLPSLLGSVRHADQGLLAYGHERPLRALDGEHFYLAHADARPDPGLCLF
jgi:hypothetical protein